VRFAQPQILWVLLAALPAVAALFYWSWRVKQNLIGHFIKARLLPGLTVGVSPRREIFRLILAGLALAGILLALARPQWGFSWEEAKQKGLDIIVAVDTSRSMLAQDVAPDRLDRAKYACLDLMREAKSDRLGLVAFAGTAFLQSPLTLDDEAFRQGVEALNVGIIPQGGTALSAAIRTSLAAFEKSGDNHKILVLFTDGEDHDADIDTLAAAKEAADAGMHIFTIGVGTPAGELLRVTDDQGNSSFIKDDDGNVVKSHLNEKLLRQIATTANGFYLPLQGADPMATLYERGLAPLPKTESTTRLTRVYLERYHYFLGFAVLCLLLEFLLPESSRSRRTDSGSSSSKKTARAVAATLCFLLATCTTQTRASPSGAYNDYQSGDYKSAFDEYSRLSEQKTNDYRLHYDAGAAAYHAKQLDKAEQQFGATVSSPGIVSDTNTLEQTYYNLGNTEYHIGEPLQEPDKKEQRWQQAIDCYSQALQLNTNDIDARNNLAYVKQKLEQLKQQQQQQQKQQKKNQQNQKNNKDQQNQQNQKNQEQQKQQQQQQDQQQADQQKSEQQKQQEEQEKQQQEQAQKQQQQQQQEQASQGEKKDQEQQEAQQAAAEGRMTPDEARQLLSEQKDDERALIFAPTNQPVATQTGKIKDW
jgi:Ca-activated chloride channel family protein